MMHDKLTRLKVELGEEEIRYRIELRREQRFDVLKEMTLKMHSLKKQIDAIELKPPRL